MADAHVRHTVVISGASGRFPASNNMEEFKENLLNSVDMVTADDSRWPAGLWNLPTRNGKIPNIDKFDTQFFGIDKDEVAFIDPQERLMLETTYEAIVDAGMDPESLRGSSTGFFLGSCFQETHNDFDDAARVPNQFRTMVTRVSRHFGFRGPIVQTDTACGSSFTALNDAFHSVKAGVCQYAVVAGTNTLFRPRVSIQFKDLKMIAKDGKSKCLDAGANGYVRSEACVVFFLQRAPEAKRIYCTILSTKSNADGYKVEGITFPSKAGQSALVAEVYNDAGIDPTEINYVEAHVTGTSAGDPVEMAAMYSVICENKQDPLYVGCLKSNMGHAEGASGACGLAKALIVYQTGLIPPNLHFKSINTNMLGLRNGKMAPVTKVMKFTGEMIPVNCFGFGGANVHVLTKIAAHRPVSGVKITVPVPRIIQLCGRTPDGVAFMAEQLVNKRALLTNDFLSLINDYSVMNHFDGMTYRSYMIVSEKQNGGYEFDMLPPLEVTNDKEVNIIFCAAEESSHVIQQMKHLPLYATTLQMAAKLSINIDDASNMVQRSVINQIALFEVLKELGVNWENSIAIKEGCIASYYAQGKLTLEQSLIISCELNQGLGNLVNRIVDHCSGISIEVVNNLIDDIRITFDQLIEEDERFLNVQIGSQALHVSTLTCGSPASNFVHAIGQLYLTGARPLISKLYPAVSYPMPSQTPSLSSLIKWKHDITIPLAPFLLQGTSYDFALSKTLQFHFDRRTPEDSFLYDHKIDGRILFPATGYLMLAWIAFSKLNSVSIYENAIEFKDISFERATVMPSSEQSFSVRINEATGQFIIKEGENIVVKGHIAFYKRPYVEPKAVGLEPVPEDCIELDSRDIYKEFRIRGYDYGNFFQGLSGARSDGRTGQLIWRDVLSKSFMESMKLETDEDVALLWLRSWTYFTDAMFQLLLMSNQDTTRNLFVPRRLESLVCHPEILRRNAATSPKFMDILTQNDASYVTAIADPDENMVWASGLVIRGLRTSLLKRKQQFVRLKKYSFSPRSEDMCLESPEHIRQVEDYYEDVVSCARRLNTGKLDAHFETNFDLNEDRHALLRALVNRVRGTVDLSPLTLDKDFLVGKMEDDWYHQERLLKPHIEHLLYESVHDSSSKLDILEYNTTSYMLSKSVMSYKEESLLSVDLSIASSVKEVLDLNMAGIEGAPASHMVIYRADEANSTPLGQLFEKFYKHTRDSGFLMVIAKDRVVNADLDSALKKLGLSQNCTMDSELIKSQAVSAGYHFISQKTLFGSLLPLTTMLFKKFATPLKVEKQMVLELGVDNYTEWMALVKDKMLQLGADPEARLWLTPRTADVTNEGINGILGFVRSIRFEENGHQVRCLIDYSKRGTPDLSDPRYSHMLTTDTVYNLYGGEKLGWGTLESTSLARDIQKDHYVKRATEHVYLKSMKPGDLSSFAWVENNMTDVPEDKMAAVHYAPLNFRDIMFATGRLQPEAIPGIPADIASDSILGLEFSGLDHNGNRIMGVVPYKAIGTTVQVEDTDLIWPVPAGWSLEEASTVPCVYATAYYALCVRGNLVKDESVLIHAGAGGVGLAAISVALAQGCRVFTTVGSQRKRDFLLAQFPQLVNQDILYSRDTTFEDDILKATNGQGVNVVLNSLAEDKLQAGLRCLAPGGRFLEIGKVDFIQDNQLFSWQVDGNRTFHGVLLDSLFKYSKTDYLPQRLIDEKRQLQCLVMQGIKEGTVRPLARTVFAKGQIEEAFRFMSSGKHIGKVVIQIRDTEETVPMAVPALKVTYMCPRKSYIVVGGLGGFGLEVTMWLASRGAKNIVVGARRPIREPYQQYSVNRMKKRGVNLVICHSPASTEEGSRVLIETAAQLGPVGGIFNTAVHYDDTLFSLMTEDQFAQVMAPKLEATIHLDRWSRKMCPQLDHFVAFSSISCGRGNAGQTNYNFANSSMDSICEKRAADGLAGTSIQWGVVGDVGIVTEKTGSSEVNLLGATSQRLHSLLDSMDRLLQSGFPVCLSYVKADKTGNADGDSVDLLKMVSRIFGLKDISALDAGATLGSLGIDSLIAVEMKQLLERVTGNSLTVKEIRDITVSSLIEMSKSTKKE
ncbi:Fatty acid synthase [Halotydeus destructor]|nr:Fatty acid synthase [Halotydeus destructor]